MLNIVERIQNQADIASEIRILTEEFPGQVAFSTSFGQEDQVLTDLICSQQLPVRIFTLDTGRLFQETYELMDLTRARYKQNFEVYYPNTEAIESFVKEQGFNSFYDSLENRKACCHLRKVAPLQRALQHTKVWITGLRAEQNENRHHVPKITWDASQQVYKYNPLIDWTYEAVLSYIEKHHIPYNKLHDQGFISIGCAPCTRAIAPGEHPRAGRWWWEQSGKECGLHVQTN
jgi:phosphoadenosine phosphosulfate reductase